MELSALLHATALDASLLAVFEEEELDAKLLRSMSRPNLLANLSELGLSADEAARFAAHLNAPPAAAPPLPQPSLRAPPPAAALPEGEYTYVGSASDLRRVVQFRRVGHERCDGVRPLLSAGGETKWRCCLGHDCPTEIICAGGQQS